MLNADYKAFIVEGEVREPQIIDNISKVFFTHKNYKIITLPAGQNIYMLWKKLKEDDFDTDIIEVLREEHIELEKQLEGLNRDNFSEVYLFFDYDGHQNNLGFRSLLRLSSALSAKASTLRSLLLDHHKECSVNPYGSRFVFKSFHLFLSPSQFPAMSSDVFFLSL